MTADVAHRFTSKLHRHCFKKVRSKP